MRDVEEARRDLMIIINHIRFAIEEARKNGEPKFAVVSERKDGGGKIECRFTCDFIEDVALIIDAPKMNEAERMKAAAKKIRDQFTINDSEQVESEIDDRHGYR